MASGGSRSKKAVGAKSKAVRSKPKATAGPGPKPTAPVSPFDVKQIRELVALMDEHRLAQIQIQDGDKRLKIVRQRPPAPAAPPVVPGTAAPVAPPSASAVDTGWPPPPVETADTSDTELVDIPSPMVGTFYSASSPDVDPYAAIGTHVSPDSTICIIEAMKVFNEIQAEVEGVVAEILVENGQSVEYGQVLFRVDPNQ